jgi:hypothetical protein
VEFCVRLAVIIVVVVIVTKDDPPSSSDNSIRDHPLKIALSPFFPDDDFPSSEEQKEALEWLIERDPLNLLGLEDRNLILQRYVLAIFSNTTIEQVDDGTTEDGEWLSGSPICSWRGITCEKGVDPLFVVGMIDNFATGLAFRLSGTIPSEIGLLAALTQLELSSSRSLVGTIPTEIGRLTDLKYLLLNDNQLNGTIVTEVGNLHKLEILLLEGNMLSGQIPSELGRLTMDLKVS